MLTSVYNGNSVQDLLDAQDWLNGGLDAIQLHSGTRDWADWLGCVAWQGELFAGQDIDIMWSIPLIPYGANLADAAAGDYDHRYLAMAQQLIANSGGSGEIYVRLGWEFNADGWNSSSAVGEPGNYIAAFRNFVEAARSLSDRFVFEWCPNIGTTDMDADLAYPGDAYVDVIGIDFYYNVEWASTDPVVAFNQFVERQFGLQWQQDFAAAHGKPTAIGEWGMNIDSPEFVKLVHDWAERHDMVYMNYWDSNAAFQGKLSDGQFADAGSAFLGLFGGALLDDILSPLRPNLINGDTGNNVLYSTDRLDVMSGHGGNDIYHVFNANEKVVEAAAEGVDAVHAAVSHTLSANVEKLYLEGPNLTGTGNALANALRGARLDDTLHGLDGDDRLIGYAGDDRLTGGRGNDTLSGNEGNDILEGGNGNDALSGGAGADSMTGGAGDDTYYVDHLGDQVVEVAGEGADGVHASVSYVLADNIENLSLEALGLTGTGNALANQLLGARGNDTLHGLGGNDTLRGYAGNDRLTGGDGNDTLNGNEGNDILAGGSGADILCGGGGSDEFVFVRDSGTDTITDFGAGDRINLTDYLATGASPTLSSASNGTLISLGDGNSIFLQGVGIDDLSATASGFAFG